MHMIPNGVDAELNAGSDFYAGLGVAIAQWAKVEYAMCTVTLACSPYPPPRALISRFYSMRNIKAKRRLVAEGLRTHPTELQNTWQSLSALVDELNEDRNKLAHWLVINEASGKKLHQPHYGRRDLGLDAEDFRRMWSSFEQCAVGIDSLAASVRAQRSP